MMLYTSILSTLVSVQVKNSAIESITVIATQKLGKRQSKVGKLFPVGRLTPFPGCAYFLRPLMKSPFAPIVFRPGTVPPPIPHFSPDPEIHSGRARA